MSLDSTAPASGAQAHVVTDAALTRAEVERLIAASLAGNKAPLHFTACDFEGVDLSRLDLHGAEFHRCTIVETSFFGAALSHTRWVRCRGREADFASADLVDAALFKGATISHAQAAVLVTELGLRVM
jgi:uncharacterized protein YjbI with pentapeptide repeats